MTSPWMILIVLLWMIVLVEGVFIVAILRSMAALHLRLQFLSDSNPIVLTDGGFLEDRSLTSLDDKTFYLADLWRSERLLLLLVSDNCDDCQITLRAFAKLRQTGDLDSWKTCILCSGSKQSVTDLLGEVGLSTEVPVALVDDRFYIDQIQIPGTPTMAIIDVDGRILDVEAGHIDGLRLQSSLKSWSTLIAPAQV